MKILAINRQYFLVGGPDKYLFSLIEMMPQHEIMPFALRFAQNVETPYNRYFLPPPGGAEGVSFDEFKLGMRGKLKLMADSIYHVEARRRLERMIVETKPDVAFFLGALFFTDSLFDACHKHCLPIVSRLSDFNRLCSAAVLFRDGRVCEECLTKGFLAGVIHRCGGTHKSLGAAVVRNVGLSISKIRRAHDRVDIFVSPSEHTKSKLVAAGYDGRKIVVIPTFVKVPDRMPNAVPDTKKILYVGRISPEKGVHILLRAFERIQTRDAVLTIVGDDRSEYARSLKASVRDELKARVVFAGYLGQAEIRKQFLHHAFFVVPSICYENLPNALLEGMSNGRAALASRLGSLSEIVQDGRTGRLFEPGDADDLAANIDYLLDHPQETAAMGEAAYRDVREHYCPEDHIKALESVFSACLGKRGKAARA